MKAPYRKSENDVAKKKTIKKDKKDVAPTFALTLNVKQVSVLIQALDFFSRIGIGQIEEVQTMLRHKEHTMPGNVEAVRSFLDAVKKQLMGLDSNETWGVFHQKVSDEFKVAWDLQQVIRNKLSWTLNPAGGFGVCFDEPMKAGTEPLATMNQVGEVTSRVALLKIVEQDTK